MFVIDPHNELCMDPIGPRSIYLPTRLTEGKMLFPFKFLQPVSKTEELNQYKIRLSIALRGGGGKTVFAYTVLTVTSPFSDLGIN